MLNKEPRHKNAHVGLTWPFCYKIAKHELKNYLTSRNILHQTCWRPDQPELRRLPRLLITAAKYSPRI
jgi:hypothetical protein